VQLSDARKKLALLKAGSRAEDIAEAQAKRNAAAALLEVGNAELNQSAVGAPAPVAQITIDGDGSSTGSGQARSDAANAP